MGRRSWSKVEELRDRIAELMRSNPGISVREIARLVHCSKSTAARHVQAVRAEWAARRAELYQEALAEDLVRTDAAIRAIWPAVMAGNLSAIKQLIRVLEYRMRLLGLDVRREEIDIGQVLARYLERMAQDGGDLAGQQDGGAVGASGL